MGKRKSITGTWYVKWNWSSARVMVFAKNCILYRHRVRWYRVGKCWARDWYDIKGYWSFSEYCRSNVLESCNDSMNSLHYSIPSSMLPRIIERWVNIVYLYIYISRYISFVRKSIFSQLSIKGITFFSIFSNILIITNLFYRSFNSPIFSFLREYYILLCPPIIKFKTFTPRFPFIL